MPPVRGSATTMTTMNNDTIPSQLPPATIPSALGRMGPSTSTRREAAVGLTPARMLVLVAVALVALYLLF